MKKRVLIVTTLLTSMLSHSQEASSGDEVIKNKKGHEIFVKPKVDRKELSV